MPVPMKPLPWAATFGRVPAMVNIGDAHACHFRVENP
jgi:hypothetical protein